MIAAKNVQTFDTIKKQYPDEWVLIGNPEMTDDEMTGSMVKLIHRGVVLFHSKDRKEIAGKAREVRKGFEHVTLVFTGKIPENRKYLL